MDIFWKRWSRFNNFSSKSEFIGKCYKLSYIRQSRRLSSGCCYRYYK